MIPVNVTALIWYVVEESCRAKGAVADRPIHSSQISSPAGSGSCEIPNTVEKPQDHVPEIVEKPQDQPPSQSEVKNSASDLDNPKPDPSSASAQSSDGPESDKPNGNNDQQPSKGHNDDPEPDSSVNAQSFDEPEVDEPEDSVQQPSEQNPTTSTYVPNASPELTAVVHNDAKNDSSSCQSPNYWNTVGFSFLNPNFSPSPIDVPSLRPPTDRFSMPKRLC